MDERNQEAIRELQNIRQIHAQRSEERQKFSLTVLLAGSGVLFAALAAAERAVDGAHPHLTLYWFIPVVVVALWSFDLRFRTHSARTEEMLERIIARQISRLIGRTAELDRDLRALRNRHVPYYSPGRRFALTTTIAKWIAGLPLFIVFAWSGLNVWFARAPHPWGKPVISETVDRLAWVSLIVVLWATVQAIYWQRRRNYQRLFRVIDNLPNESPAT